MKISFAGILSVGAALVALHLSTAAIATPIGLYAFEGNGLDSSGNGNNSTNVAAPFSGAGFEGMAADFTPNQLISLPLNINPGVAPRVTIGAWVDADVVGAAGFRTTILSSDSGGFDRGINIDDRNGGPNSGVATYAAFTGPVGGVLPGTPASAADGYVFVAAVYDQVAGTVTLNVDGATFTRTNVRTDPSQSFMNVGLHPFNIEPLDGRVDNVFVYNSALTNEQLEAIRTGGIAAAQTAGVRPGQMWQVDLQVGPGGAFGSGPGVTNPGIGAGDVWNTLTVPAFTAVPVPNPAVNPVFANLKDSTGADTGLTFSIIGSVNGYNNTDPNAPINTDYFFWGVPGTSNGIQWSIDGLQPGFEYEFVALGGVDGGRVFNMLIDTNGDGSLMDETGKPVLAGLGTGAVFESVFADASGRIIGSNANAINGGEANWGGFQIRQITVESAIPEPGTCVLLAAGLAGVALRRRRAA